MKRHCKTWVLSAAVLISAATGLPSCNRNDTSSARVRITTQSGEELSSTFQVPLSGGDAYLDVYSERPLDLRLQNAPGEGMDWFTITGVDQISSEKSRILYSAQPLKGTLDQRSLSLNLSAPDVFLGAFLSVRQGYGRVWSESFAGWSGGEMGLQPGSSWESPTLDGISSTYACYLALNVRSEPLASGTLTSCPLVVTLEGSGVFEDIGRNEYVLDAPASTSYATAGYLYLRISNGGVVFSSETTLSLSVAPAASGRVFVRDVTLYEIPVSGGGIIGTDENDEE